MVAKRLFANLIFDVFRNMPRTAVVGVMERRDKMKMKMRKTPSFSFAYQAATNDVYAEWRGGLNLVATGYEPPNFKINSISAAPRQPMVHDGLNYCFYNKNLVLPDNLCSHATATNANEHITILDGKSNDNNQRDKNELFNDMESTFESQNLLQLQLAMDEMEANVCNDLDQDIAEDEIAPQNLNCVLRPNGVAPAVHTSSIGHNYIPLPYYPYSSKIVAVQLNYSRASESALERKLISWQSDFQAEAKQLVKNADEFVKDCSKRIVVLTKQFLEITSDEKIMQAIVKALKDIGLVMQRLAQAIAEIINKILNALGVTEPNLEKKSLLVAQASGNVAKAAAKKIKDEGAKLFNIANDISSAAGKEAQKEVKGVVNYLNDFGKNVNDFSNKLEKQAASAIEFTKVLMKSSK